MNGILLIDKPAGWTSHDVVAKLRSLLRERRIGHSGTLDPMATGLLVVFLGRATKAVEFAEADEKEYIAGLRLGLSTDTQDITGTVLSERPREVSERELTETLETFTGQIEQIPPMYSAIKVNGQKLCDVARRGGSVERKPRRITIFEIENRGKQEEDQILRVRCSKGTYIRTLCHDVGESLGCGGCMSSLRRTRAGAFSLEQAHTLEEVAALAAEGRAEELLLSVDSLFADCEAVTLSAAREKKLRNGVSFPLPLADGRYRAYAESGAFLALARCSGGDFRAIKSFYEV
ncbi:MAG: tRNA pseudouridine(55) synthase TruB [Oscillospiraceae bacterium]